MSKLWDCPNCGAKRNDGLFCPECGSKSPILYCQKCRKLINSKFCTKCGEQATPLQIIDRGDYFELSPNLDNMLYILKKAPRLTMKKAHEYIESLPKIEGHSAYFADTKQLLEIYGLNDIREALMRNGYWFWSVDMPGSYTYDDEYGNEAWDINFQYHEIVDLEDGSTRTRPWADSMKACVLAYYHYR